MKKLLKCILCILLAVLTAGFSAWALEPAETEVESETAAIRKQYKRGELVCTYTFTVYGWGHGVGLSQYGAIAYADVNGRYKWNYVQILLHYYPQCHMAYEEDIPSVMTRGGVSYPTREYLAHTTMAEIGGDCGPAQKEAFKAQIVAIYTFLKHNNYSVSAGSIAYTSTQPSAVIYECVDEVIGQYVAYNGGSAAGSGLFAASTCGRTASAAGTWGGSGYPGLDGGLYSPEPIRPRTVIMDAQDIIRIANVYNDGKPAERKIHLSGDPSTWLEILEHDGAYSEHIGYVTKLRIGDQTMSGTAFRNLLFRVPDVPGLRCHCFSLTYDLVPGENVLGNDPADYTAAE